MQEQESRFEVFNGNSVRASFAAGTRIRIIGVPEQKQEERITFEEGKDYLITSVTFSATELGYTDDKAGDVVAKLISDAAIAGALRGLDRFDDAQLQTECRSHIQIGADGDRGIAVLDPVQRHPRHAGRLGGIDRSHPELPAPRTQLRTKCS